MTYIKFIFLLFLFAFLQQTIAQTPVDSVVMHLNRLAVNGPEEIIYLQTSKGIYETGEDLWFKAYLLDAQSHLLSLRSRTLYLQMSSEKDKTIVWQERYPIEAGIVAGHVYLPEDLPEENYMLNAFTRHSFFADSTEVHAVRKVKIQKNITRREKLSVETNCGIRLATFPEGGYLIAGIPSKLAFKATNELGFPADVKGILYEDDAPLLEFESFHAGMGSVRFTPLSDRSYRMQLSDGNSFPLPEILPEGISMQLTKHNEEFLEFIVSQSGNLPAQTIYMTGQMRGIECFTSSGQLGSLLKIRVPLDVFHAQGIAAITLFDSNGMPVAERLVYVHPEKRLHIIAKADRDNYNIRDKATVQIKVTDENGQPVRAHLGMSVFDYAYVNPEDPVNILTHYYLSSQIRGRIYDPVYYFDEENPNRVSAMDLLMLTQGWRRFVWGEENLHKKGNYVLADEITGKLTLTKKRKAVNDQGKKIIQISDSDENTFLLSSDSTGFFSISIDDMKSMRDKGYIYIKPMLMPSDEGKPNIQLDDPFLSVSQIIRMKEIFYPIFDLNRIERKETFGIDSVMIQKLSEVVISGYSQKPLRDKQMGRLDSLVRMKGGAWVCECGHLNDYWQEYTHHPPEAPTYRGKRIMPIPGKTYRMIKYEPSSNPGIFNVVDIVTDIVYNGHTYTDEELLEKNGMWRTKAYHGYREFYQPDEAEMRSSIPDFRNTLLWAPEIITDANGEATVSFYCSDINTVFTGRIEGVGGEGLLGTAKFDFRVNNNN